MKRVLSLILIAFLVLTALPTEAQQYTVGVDNQLISSTKTKKTGYVKTKYTLTIKDITYPVYKSVRGKFFIIRTSKKTGNEYKQYLKIEE